MTRTGMEIIVRTKDITRNYTGIQSAMLVMVTSVCNIYKPLGVTVTIIWRMWRPIMNLGNYLFIYILVIFTCIYYNKYIRYVWYHYHCFIDWISCLIWKYTSGKARNNLGNIMFVSNVENIVVHVYIIPLQRKNLLLRLCDKKHTAKYNYNMNDTNFFKIFTRKSKLCDILWKSPPTIAARWITCVGLYWSNNLRVLSLSLWKDHTYN